MNYDHTAQSLGKYLGMRLWVKAHQIPGDVIIKVAEGMGVLRGVAMSGFISLLFTYPGEPTQKRVRPAICEECYPVLKTVDQLTEEDCIYIYSPWNWMDGPEDVSKDFHVDTETEGVLLQPMQLLRLIEKGYGAVPNKNSPTGHVSIHDGLACWVEK